RGLPVSELPLNNISALSQVIVEGHDGNNTEQMPPLEMTYSNFDPTIRKFAPVTGDSLPWTSMSEPTIDFVSLFGNGLPDIVQINGYIRYWRNLGNGRFAPPQIMPNSPTGYNLGDPNVQFMDVMGDGRADLYINNNQISGFYTLDFNGTWDNRSFQSQKVAPSFSFADPEVKLMDMSGDGVTDVLRNGAQFQIFYNDPEQGWNAVQTVNKDQ